MTTDPGQGHPYPQPPSGSASVGRSVRPVAEVLAERARWLDRVQAIRQWTRDGQRAPHKPLLILYALGRLQRTGSSASTFVDAEEPLKDLLRDFGPPKPTSPAYPFHHLGSDGFWTVTATDGYSGSSAKRLREGGASGGFSPELEGALLADPGLVVLLGRAVLEEHFAPSLHADICSLAGLDLDAVEEALVAARVAELRRRDPEFRRQVLVAYEFRCAMCGYDGRLGGDAVGLDAAHVRWWAFEGPDTLDNGLCLCSLHHKLLDRGVMGVDVDHRVTVSEAFMASGPSAEVLVFDLLGRPIGEPQRGKPTPADDHLAWHATQVFRGPSRIPA